MILICWLVSKVERIQTPRGNVTSTRLAAFAAGRGRTRQRRFACGDDAVVIVEHEIGEGMRSMRAPSADEDVVE